MIRGEARKLRMGVVGGGDGDNITSCNLYFVFRSSAHHHVIRILFAGYPSIDSGGSNMKRF